MVRPTKQSIKTRPRMQKSRWRQDFSEEERTILCILSSKPSFRPARRFAVILIPTNAVDTIDIGIPNTRRAGVREGGSVKFEESLD